jgi:hypothetical protein
MYYVGTEMIEILGKLMGPKKDYLKYGKTYILGTKV